MLRPRRRLVLEDEGETVDVAKPGGVGDTGCENISLGSDRQRVLLFFFLGGRLSVEVALLQRAVNEELRH